MRTKLCSITLICIMITFLLCPIFTTQSFVYADSTTDQWESVTTNEELAEAFRYYCKSRNLSVEGSVLDAVTNTTTNIFTEICNTLGIDMTALQANLKKSTDSNGKLQFLFDATGISTYNRIFAEFLQNNNLTVGDSVDDEVIDEGFLFTDADGYSCKVFVAVNNRPAGNITEYKASSVYQQKGSPYIYSATDTYSFFDSRLSISQTYNLTSTLSVNLTGAFLSGSRYNFYHYDCSPKQYNTNSWATVLSAEKSGTLRTNGYPTVIYYPYSNKLCFGTFMYPVNNSGESYSLFPFIDITDGTKQDYTVFITTNNTTINNNTYEGDTIINNEGDTGGESGGGESGGGESGGDTSIDVDFPDFNFNIPDLNFQLSGLTDKFPFCIPFDIVALLGLLNAEPQAPHIQGTIPFGNWFTWELDFDFSRFDDFATMMRGFELVGFIFFLVGATIHFAKG